MKTQCGNALFLILIAVALFAALSYAVTQSGRGGGGIDKEQAQILGAQITQYSSSIDQSIQRLRLIGNCKTDQISFHYDSDKDGVLETDGSDEYYNPNSPVDFSCHVFHPNGGGLSLEENLTQYFDISQPFNDLTINSLNTIDGIGTTVGDLALYLSGIEDSICKSINDKLGYGSEIFPNVGGVSVGLGRFVGEYSEASSSVINGGTPLLGETVGCFEETSGCGASPCNHYYHAFIIN